MSRAAEFVGFFLNLFIKKKTLIEFLSWYIVFLHLPDSWPYSHG